MIQEKLEKLERDIDSKKLVKTTKEKKLEKNKRIGWRLNLQRWYEMITHESRTSKYGV